MLVDQPAQTERLIVFQTRFADGTQCSTSHVPASFFARAAQARPRELKALAFFDIEDPARLARLHQAAVEKHQAGPVDTGTIEQIEWLAEQIEREALTQIEAGYQWRKGDEYVPTRIGALKMVSKLMGPSSATDQIRPPVRSPDSGRDGSLIILHHSDLAVVDSYRRGGAAP